MTNGPGPSVTENRAPAKMRRPGRGALRDRLEMDERSASTTDPQRVPVAEQAGPAAEVDFDQLVALHYPRVTRLARRLLGWPADVEDVVQEVFLAALRGLPKFRGEAELATWLSSITVNRCRSYQRRLVVRLRAWTEVLRPSARLSTEGNQERTEPEDLAEVRQAVARLPRREREVVVLHYLEELPIMEVARMLRLSRGAVDVRLTRARQRLRGMLRSISNVE